MAIGLLGKKIGMTRVYDANGKATPVTVIAAEANALIQVKTEENDGYSAVKVGYDAQKESRLTKPVLGQFNKAGVEPKKIIREFRLRYGQTPEDVSLSSVSQH